MKNKLKFILAIAVSALMLSACSNQYRTADSGMSDQEVLELIESFNPQLSAQNAADSGIVTGMLENFNSYVVNFYAGQTGNMGANGSFFSFVEMGHVGHPGKTIFDVEYEDGLQDVKVIFLDVQSRETFERRFILYVKLTYNGGQEKLVTFTSPDNSWSFTEDEFEITLQSSESFAPIVLRTYDVSDEYADELSDAVKFRVWVNEGGQEFDIGQISTLSGFGQ